jgi:hypothetical protein
MSPETIDKLSISLGFMEAQAVGTFAIVAMVMIVVCVLGWMGWMRSR